MFELVWPLAGLMVTLGLLVGVLALAYLSRP